MRNCDVSTKRRICVISQYYPPDMVGSGRRTAYLVKELIKRNFKVTLITTVSHYPDGNIDYWRNRRFFKITRNGSLVTIMLWMPPFKHHSRIGRLINYLHFTVASLLLMPLVGPVDLIMAMSPNFFVYPIGLFYKIFKIVKFFLYEICLRLVVVLL